MNDSSREPDNFEAGPPNGRELRRAERFRIEAPLEWKLASGGSWTEGVLMDLSVSGIAFQLVGSLEVGQKIVLRVFPPSVLENSSEIGSQPILIRATIRNARPMGEGSTRCGAEFERLYFLFGEWGRAYQQKDLSKDRGKDGQV